MLNHHGTDLKPGGTIDGADGNGSENSVPVINSIIPLFFFGICCKLQPGRTVTDTLGQCRYCSMYARMRIQYVLFSI